MFKVFAAISLICLVALYGVASIAEEPKAEEPIPVASMEPQTFKVKAAEKVDVQEFTWRRPSEVSFVLLHGCGGGGNGGRAHQTEDGAIGRGGVASIPITILIAVTADSYAVKIGKGGEDTTFLGEGIALKFGHGSNASGGGIDGEASPYGPGGKGAARNTAPVAGSAVCSGGGGDFPYRVKARDSKGAAGGPGFLIVYPLPDIARFARVLAIVEKLSVAPREAASSVDMPSGQSSATASEQTME